MALTTAITDRAEMAVNPKRCIVKREICKDLQLIATRLDLTPLWLGTLSRLVEATYRNEVLSRMMIYILHFQKKTLFSGALPRDNQAVEALSVYRLRSVKPCDSSTTREGLFMNGKDISPPSSIFAEFGCSG
jgi:hypothetical protein